jgi:hypothetical protein
VDHESTATVESAGPSFADIPGIVVWTAFAGFGAALAGFIDGVVLMAKRAEGRCYVATGSFPCKVHPRLGEGLAISAIALSVGALVLLLAYVAAAMSKSSKA